MVYTRQVAIAKISPCSAGRKRPRIIVGTSDRASPHAIDTIAIQ